MTRNTVFLNFMAVGMTGIAKMVLVTLIVKQARFTKGSAGVAHASHVTQ
jgi:hypothetical protein